MGSRKLLDDWESGSNVDTALVLERHVKSLNKIISGSVRVKKKKKKTTLFS